MKRYRILALRALLASLILSGLAAWIAAVAAFAFDASPLDNLDVDFHVSWVRSVHAGEYKGRSAGQPVPATVEGWPKR